MERMHKGIEYDYKHVTILYFYISFPLKASSLFTVPASSAVRLFICLSCARSARKLRENARSQLLINDRIFHSLFNKGKAVRRFSHPMQLFWIADRKPLCGWKSWCAILPFFTFVLLSTAFNASARSFVGSCSLVQPILVTRSLRAKSGFFFAKSSAKCW